MHILVSVIIISMLMTITSPFGLSPLLRPVATRLLASAPNSLAPPPKSGGRASASVTKLNSDSSSPSLISIATQPMRGTRDFYPADLRLRTWLFDNFRKAAHKRNFVEYDAPLLELTDLYTRKAGDEIVSQLYSFTDQGGRSVSLRPEMTPSLARMVLSKAGTNGLGLPLPLKWFSLPQCWRYERTTRGRRREHYQWNMDVWGVQSEMAEAELIASMIDVFRGMGLTHADVTVKVNTRELVYDVLSTVGVPDDIRGQVCVLVDKLDKVTLDDLMDDFNSLGVSSDSAKKIVEILTCESIDDIALYLPRQSNGVTSLNNLYKYLKANGVDDKWIKFDAKIIRGLSYYTGIVFEAVDKKGELRAIAGGGRYDNLLGSLGGKSTSAVGFGFGDAVIVELLKERGVLPDFSDKNTAVDYVVYTSDDDAREGVLMVSRILRENGYLVDAVLDAKKSKWAFKHADRLNAKNVVVVGENEWKDGVVSVKDMESGEQRIVRVDDLQKNL
jgi:histidyl-tRNA synthetase